MGAFGQLSIAEPASVPLPLVADDRRLCRDPGNSGVELVELNFVRGFTLFFRRFGGQRPVTIQTGGQAQTQEAGISSDEQADQ